MKKHGVIPFFLLLTSFCFTTAALAQKLHYVTFSLTDNASTYPFTMLFGFAKEPLHAGVEVGWARENLIRKHSWTWELRGGYFNHQFVQHGIPLYATYGYRYLFTRHWSADVSLGLGYLHSIPATDVYKLDADGNYVNGKGIGRPQVMVPFTLGADYAFKLGNGRDARVFLRYQQRLQAPFVKSYVPLLPYVQISIGGAMYLKDHKKGKP